MDLRMIRICLGFVLCLGVCTLVSGLAAILCAALGW